MTNGIATTIVLLALCSAAGSDARAADSPDLSFAKRMFTGKVIMTKNYACFSRHYDSTHMAQHPLQKVRVMKLLITSETNPDDRFFSYSFRLGVNFRNRPGSFDSSGDCGHAPTVRAADGDADSGRPAGIDFSCGVDCDGGGLSVDLAKDNGSVIVKLEAIRIWKGNNFDESAATELKAGADDKVFRLDREISEDCKELVTDRKELAAMRRK